jgi:hypothetical protein
MLSANRKAAPAEPEAVAQGSGQVHALLMPNAVVNGRNVSNSVEKVAVGGVDGK